MASARDDEALERASAALAALDVARQGGQVVGFHQLDSDCLLEILMRLDVRQQSVASCVCSRWLAAVRSLPMQEMHISLLKTPAECLPGFETWLVRRLRSPLGATLRKLRLEYCTHDQQPFTQGQRRIFAALTGCSMLTDLQVLSEAHYSEFDWDAIQWLPTQLRRLEILHVNLPFDARNSAAGGRQRWVTLQHMTLPALEWLRISCMPKPNAAFQADALWCLVCSPPPSALRQLKYLELSAACADIGGASQVLVVATALTELRLKASFMSTAGMSAVSQLPLLRSLRLQLGPPTAQANLHLLEACISLRSLSVTYDMRTPRLDALPIQQAQGDQPPIEMHIDVCEVPQLEALRFMIFPDSQTQPSANYHLDFNATPEALRQSRLQVLDLRLARAHAEVPLDVLVRLQELHTFRLQAGYLKLLAPQGADGQLSWRGSAGMLQPWLTQLQGVHLRCAAAEGPTSAAMQAFEMLDGDCVYEQSIAAGADDDGGGDPLLHLWKGDANATCLAEFGLAA